MVMVALLAAILCACDAISLNPESTPEPVTITLAFNETDLDIANALIGKFHQRYPEITVGLYPVTYDELVVLGPGTADVRAIPQEIVAAAQARGDLRSLDSFIRQDESFDRSDFYPGMLEAFTLDDEIWALPLGADPMVMYYNKSLFDQHDLPYPQIGWTWDDFLDDALAINNPAAGIYGYVPMEGHRAARLFIYQYGGQVYNDVQHPNRPTFDNPMNVEALEWYAKMFFDYQIVPPVQITEAGEEAVGRAILQSQVGIWAAPFYYQGGRPWPVKWTTINWGMVTFPRSKKAIDGDLYAVGFGISSQSQYPGAAWQLVDFLSRQAWNDVTPARKSVAESAAYEQEVGAEVAGVARQIMENGVPYSPAIFTEFDERVRQVFGEAWARILSREMTPQEALNWAQREAEAAMNQ